MPMPHRTFAQVAKRRLIGKEGRERIREVRALLAELPDYKNGPYADLRKSLLAEIEDTRVRSNAVHRDSIAVRREGAAQIALVGPPNVGKSSLLQALSEIQIKTGDYPFTTLRPVPALTRIGGVLVQLVEIPGLIEGATEDRGGGRALLGVLRSADAIVYCARADARPARARRRSLDEVAWPASRSRRSSRRREPTRRRRRRSTACPAAFPGLTVVAVSVIDEAVARRVPRRGLAADRPDPGPPADERGDRRRSHSRWTPGARSPTSPTRSTTTSRPRASAPASGVRRRGSTASASAASTRSRTATSSRCSPDRVDTADAASLVSIPIDMYRR